MRRFPWITAWMSFKIGAISATAALVLGTIAAMVLQRFGRFRAKTLLTGMISAPLVMPEVITGLSLLLLFVAMESAFGWPAVIIAHTTFCMAFVAVVVQARLADMDRDLEDLWLAVGVYLVARRFGDREFCLRAWRHNATYADFLQSSLGGKPRCECLGHLDDLDRRRGCNSGRLVCPSSQARTTGRLIVHGVQPLEG